MMESVPGADRGPQAGRPLWGGGCDRGSAYAMVRDRQTLTRSLPLPVLTSSQIYSIRRSKVLMKSFRSFYINYLFLLILSVVPFASAQDTKLPPDVRLSEGSKLDKSQAGYYRMKIGMIDVIALTDGTIGVDFLALLTNTKPGEVESLLAREYVKPTAVEASMNAYLIQLDNKLILIDTGAGELLGPKLNKLPDSLRAVGIQPEQITDILLTHIHSDHSGGLTVGGRRIFPKAVVHVDKREMEIWTEK